jgi:transposase
MKKWCRLLKEGRTSVHDKERSGRPSLVSDDLKENVNAKIRESRRFTISELHEHFSDVSQYLMDKIVTDWLKGSAASFYDDGIQYLVQRYTCLNLHDDYMEN